MKTTILGPGAIGAQLTTRLHEGGAEVSVLARGARLAAIRANGLRLQAGGTSLTARVPASDDGRELGVQDVVLVTVKAPSLPGIIGSIGPLLGPDTVVVFVTNGIPWWYFHRHGGRLDGQRLPTLDPGDALLETVGIARTAGAVAYAACSSPEPGVSVLNDPAPRLILGTPDGTVPPRLQQLAALFDRGGLHCEISLRIRDEIWTKLLGNIAAGPLAVLAQAPLDRLAAEPPCRQAMRAMLEEAMAVARGLGRAPAGDTEAILARLSGLKHKPSILQDLERGVRMEVEAQFSAPVALARLAGVAVPTLELFATLARMRAEAAGLL